MSDVSFVSGRTLRESSPAWDHPGVQITPMDNGCLATVPRPKPVQLSARFIESESTCLAVNGCDLEFGMPKAKYILPWSTMGLQFCWHYCSVQVGSHWRNRRFNKAGCVQINAGLPRPSGPSLQDILAFGLRKPMVDSRCSSCKLGWMTKAWSEFLWGTKGALNHWGSAWEKCEKLIDSHCSNLFSSIYQICPAGLWDEMNLLAVSPETLHLQASRACYTERLHHQVLGLEARVMQINQIRCKKLNWEQARVMVRGTSGDRTTTSEQILQKLQKKTATSKVFQELLRMFLNHCGTQSWTAVTLGPLSPNCVWLRDQKKIKSDQK